MDAAAAARPTLLDRVLRPGRASSRDTLLDVCWLVGFALVLLGAGLGLRDPWAPDEPRFALVAQDMLRSGDWLIPRVGGDLYADKPPLFFWLMATAIAATDSLRIGFLLPSLLAGVGTTLLVYDLLRRARGREVAFAGALLLLLTFQFLWQARQAQIDGVLCFLTTLSLYGLLRHLLLGPATGWFLVGWAAAGFGVITKGVGFLPLLILAPCAMFARRGWPMAVKRFGGESVAGAAALLIAIGVWFVPMMIATSAGGELLAYRNEILFQQTVTRYTDAWHHREPPWYFVVHVVPLFWLPLIALLPWLWPRWRTALRERDTWVAVLLAWVVLVLVFFSASPGKRGVYVLPALPALALAAAPWLPELLRARGPRRLAFGLATLLVSCAALAAGYYLLDGAAAERVVRDLGLRPVPVLVIAVLTGAVPLALLRVRDGWLAYLGVLVAILLTVGVAISPQIDRARSGRAFMERIERQAEGVPELGLVGYKDQYLLQLRRPVVHFGHARWREAAVEAADAAAWLVEREGRALVMNHGAWQACFANAATVDLGRANGDRWFLVTGSAEPSCVRVGDPTRARQYFPPNVSYVTES